MQVIIAKNSGFCRGVRNAVDKAFSIEPENTYILGEIIHNADICKRISDRGIITADSLGDVPSGARMIIRSHGVGREVYDECKRRNIEIVDCTCEFVRRTQRIVSRESAKGKSIVIIGEPSHPEIIGLRGWCSGECFVFSSDKDDFSILDGKEICVVSQTTFSKEKFDKIIKIISEDDRKIVEVFQTICYTTISRQAEAEKLSGGLRRDVGYRRA